MDRPKMTLEKELGRKLRWMGWTLLFIASLFLWYAMTVSPHLAFEQEEGLPIFEGEWTISSPGKKLNFYGITGIFSSIGLLCLIYGRKKAQ